MVDNTLFQHYSNGVDKGTQATLIQEGSKLFGDLIRLAASRPRLAPRTEECAGSEGSVQPQVQEKPVSIPVDSVRTVGRVLPTSAETTHELKRRLARELYRAELDLAGGLKIAGKACDCLEYKHSVGLEAAAEELVSQDPGNPVYKEILHWTNDNLPKVTVEAIQSGKFDKEYPQMAAKFKEFRKRVVGTDATPQPGSSFKTVPIQTATSTLTLEEAQEIAARKAREEVRIKWVSVEKK